MGKLVPGSDAWWAEYKRKIDDLAEDAARITHQAEKLKRESELLNRRIIPVLVVLVAIQIFILGMVLWT